MFCNLERGRHTGNAAQPIVVDIGDADHNVRVHDIENQRHVLVTDALDHTFSLNRSQTPRSAISQGNSNGFMINAAVYRFHQRRSGRD